MVETRCQHGERRAHVAALFIGVVLTTTAQPMGGGDLVFKPEDPGIKAVLFSHEKHLVGQGMKCSTCHYHIFQMTKGSYKMKMSKMTKGLFCGKCHNGEKAFDVKEKRNCVKCHNRNGK